MTSKTSFAISPIQYHLLSRLASWMHITNLVTTTTSVMCLHSTHGLHVHELLSNTSLPDFALLVLDPQISYEGLKADHADNFMLLDHLEQLKANFSDYFDKHYVISTNMPMSSSAPSASLTTPLVEGSPQKSFTAQYCRKEKSSTNELEEYFKLPAEDFDTCNPIHWWVG